MRILLLSMLLATSVALAGEAPNLSIDKDRVTVSGISAGAHMASQLHIAYSDIFSGAGIVSGGPYNCAGNSILTAMKLCMMNSDTPLPVVDLVSGIKAAVDAGKLADTANLADDRVWMFHGTKDSKISPQVHSEVTYDALGLSAGLHHHDGSSEAHGDHDEEHGRQRGDRARLPRQGPW